jgi:uncharacterized membrane protein
VGMNEPYNRFTGQSLDRLTALTDGVFAVAMTLLVLDLRVPVGTAASAYSEHGLWEVLLKLGSPRCGPVDARDHPVTVAKL